MPGAQAQAHKTWVLTLNNFTVEEFEFLKKIECNFKVLAKEHMVAAVHNSAAAELHPDEEATPHIQGVITFSKSVRLHKLKGLSPRAHWEPCKDREQAVNYCLKEDKDPYIEDNRTFHFLESNLRAFHFYRMCGRLVYAHLDDHLFYDRLDLWDAILEDRDLHGYI